MKNEINLAKNMVYLILFFMFVFFMFFYMIIPTIKEYKNQNYQLSKNQLSLNSTQSSYDEQVETINRVKKDNAYLLASLENEFKISEFFVKNRAFFQNLDLKDSGNGDYLEGFTYSQKTVTAQIDAPESFYKFLETLNEQDNLTGISFPIVYEKLDKNGVKLSFNIRIYGYAKQ